MTNVDFHDQLGRQLLFLRNSCNLYDKDYLEEAIRIATCIRVLFHDTGRSVSILTHLQSETCELLSTVMAEKGRRDTFALVDMKGIIGAEFKAYPKLDNAKFRRFIPFDEWWHRERILNTGKVRTRKELAVLAASQDGGAHVDAKLDEGYRAVTAGFGMGLAITENDDGPIQKDQQVVSTLQDLHFASLRQIGYEILNSPALIQLQNRPPALNT